ncbi:MAG: TetR family transcriptional regulator [Gammaproteobacteria bacterium]|nr:MAG: TetR family transcriptional regulator [Gammaproteobacteria bacterium]
MTDSTDVKPTTKARTKTPTSSGAQNILSAAEELFAQQGYSSISINAIAKQAGVSKANVFHHFDTKETLYIAVLQNASIEMGHLIAELDSGNGSASQQIGRYARQHLQNLFDKARVTQLILRELQQGDKDESVQLVHNTLNKNFTSIVNIIKKFQDQGEFRQDIEAAMIATVLIGCNLFYFQTSAVLDQFPELAFAKDPDNYCNQLTDILLRGIENKSTD